MIFQTPKLPAEYLTVIDGIEGLKKQLKYHVQQHPRRWTGLLRRNTFAKNIQGSNSIEGYDVSEDDAIAAVEDEEPFDEKTEAWMAIAGYRAAMSYVLQLGEDPHYEHNIGTIRSLHYIMVGFDISKNPGRWRPGGIFVRHEPSGEIVYEGPDAELVPNLMDELIESLKAAEETSVLVRGAMAHLNLVMIHPFSDGNGRMGRALQTMVLAREGLLDPVFSSIEEYLGRCTLDYYKVLGTVGQGSWHPENDTLPWIRFCLTAHYRQAAEYLLRIKETAALWDLMEYELRQRGMNERLALALVDAAFRVRVRNASYRRIADVSAEVASRDLKALAEQGFLDAKGEKRGRYYVANDWLKQKAAQVKHKRTQPDPFAPSTIVPTLERKNIQEELSL
jgi:Fic family protein